MQQLPVFTKKLSKTFFSISCIVLLLIATTSMALGQSNELTILSVDKSKNTVMSHSKMSDFGDDLKLGKAFFLTLDISKFGNIEDVDIAVSVSHQEDIAVLFTGEIGRLSKDDTITLPIYLNLDLPEGNSSIAVNMTFKDAKGHSFQVKDRVHAYLNN